MGGNVGGWWRRWNREPRVELPGPNPNPAMISSSSSNWGKGRGRPDGLAVLAIESATTVVVAVLVSGEQEPFSPTLLHPAVGDGRLVEDRLNENRREKRRSPDGGETTTPPRPGVSTAPRVDLSSSRLRLRVPRNLSRMDLPVSNALSVPVLLNPKKKNTIHHHLPGNNKKKGARYVGEWTFSESSSSSTTSSDENVSNSPDSQLSSEPGAWCFWRPLVRPDEKPESVVAAVADRLTRLSGVSNPAVELLPVELRSISS